MPADAPNFYFTSRRTKVFVRSEFGLPPLYSTHIDFAINNIGQTGIGDATYHNMDLRIHTHSWPTEGDPIAVIEADDDNGLTVFCVENVGTSANSCGYMFVHSNSAGASNPAIAVLDQAHNLNPMFQVTSDGIVSTGVNRGIGAIAQLDVMHNNSIVDYMFHIGSYDNSTSDFLSVHNNGYVGIGQLNSGASLFQVSDVNSIGATGTPLLLVDNGGTGNPYFVVNGSNTGINVGIGMMPGGSTLSMKGIGGTSLDLFAGATTGTGWDNQIRFWNHDGTQERHLITDDYGSGNLLIYPGWDVAASNVVEIAGSELVDGNEQVNGTLRIGATQSGSTLPNAQFANYQLSVDGQIASKELIVQVMSWSDTVFSNTYRLKPLQEVQEYIQKNQHLPEVPDEREVMQYGVSVGQMNATLLKKVEELTLYVLQQQKEIDVLKVQLKSIAK